MVPASRSSRRSCLRNTGPTLTGSAHLRRRTRSSPISASSRAGWSTGSLRRSRRSEACRSSCICWRESLPTSLIERARGADLLVIGHRGRGGAASALLGSVGLHCVLHAECPVTVIRPKLAPAVVREPDAGPRHMTVTGCSSSTGWSHPSTDGCGHGRPLVQDVADARPREKASTMHPSRDGARRGRTRSPPPDRWSGGRGRPGC